MKIRVKDFGVNPDLGNRGIQLDVYDPKGKKHLGDVRFGRATIEWCKGRTRNGNGKAKSWEDFINWMEG